MSIDLRIIDDNIEWSITFKETQQEQKQFSTGCC